MTWSPPCSLSTMLPQPDAEPSQIETPQKRLGADIAIPAIPAKQAVWRACVEPSKETVECVALELLAHTEYDAAYATSAGLPHLNAAMFAAYLASDVVRFVAAWRQERASPEATVRKDLIELSHPGKRPMKKRVKRLTLHDGSSLADALADTSPRTRAFATQVARHQNPRLTGESHEDHYNRVMQMPARLVDFNQFAPKRGRPSSVAVQTLLRGGIRYWHCMTSKIHRPYWCEESGQRKSRLLDLIVLMVAEVGSDLPELDDILKGLNGDAMLAASEWYARNIPKK